jgi:hypothetical protein
MPEEESSMPIHTRLLYALFLILFLTFGAYAQAPPTKTVQNEAKHDESPALSSIPRRPAVESGIVVRKEHRVKPLPKPAPRERRTVPDSSVQKKSVKKFQANVLTPFEGIGKGTYSIQDDPPDTNGAVGATQYVEWVNAAFAVFDKHSGNLIGNILDGNLLFKGFGGDCEQYNDGDPIVLYDKQANRWVLSQFAVSGGQSTPGGTFSHCVAVSETSDATGKYYRYEFKFNDFNDYPKMGVWPDAYYVSFNMFHGDSFSGAKACAYNRNNMLMGQPASMQCFDIPDLGGLLPSDLDGLKTSQAGLPNIFLNFDMDGSHLNLWKFHVDWNNTNLTTWTGPQKVSVSAFNIPCDSCVVQPRGGIGLQTLGDRLMYRLAYRAFNDHDSVVVSHTVATGTGTGIRWYEIRNPASNPTIAQQSTFAPDNNFRWIGSLAMDKVGNVAMGYSVSGNNTYPAIRFTSRNANDPPGTMSAEQIIKPGVGVQTNPDRWGDYASMSVDPVDDCTLYFATQYAGEAGAGQFNWHTAITRLKFPNCN